MSTLSPEETEALQHRLAMYQQLASLYPREHKHLQKQAEVLLLLQDYEEAELVLEKLQSVLLSLNKVEEAKKAANIKQHLNKEQHCNKLYSTPFLHLASSSFIEKAFRKHRRVELKEGEYLIHYGKRDNQMYIVVRGELAVWSRNLHGEKHFEHTMVAGEVIGELAFLDSTPRSADVIACCDSVLLSIPSKAALKLFMESPEIEAALRKEANARRIQMEIKNNPALSKLPRNLQSMLANHATFEKYQTLERMYASGSNIESIDLVCSGHIRLVGEKHDGSSLVLNSLKQGSLIGCSSVIPEMENTYIADIVSMDEVTVIHFPLTFFRKLLDANPRLYQAVLQYAEEEQGSLLQTISSKSSLI